MAASTVPRYGIAKNDDATGRNTTMGWSNPAYAATLNLKPNAYDTNVVVAQLTGACTVNLDTSRAFAGDEISLLFSADASIRVVTLGTGTSNAGTISVAASKKASVRLKFDGVTWVEQCRTVTA
ncbi:MAG: hypothetical protein KGO82_19165 [Bacteroidota bacterium]|nr:hypothetical protein [Bacteroidota bacterium]